MTIGSALAATPVDGVDTKPKSLKEAAESFEGLLLAEMLRSARESGGTSLSGEPGESASSSIVDHAESILASQLAKAGGLGLSTNIVRQLQGASSVSAANQKEHSIGS